MGGVDGRRTLLNGVERHCSTRNVAEVRAIRREIRACRTRGIPRDVAGAIWKAVQPFNTLRKTAEIRQIRVEHPCSTAFNTSPTRPIARARRLAWWHSETVTCFVRVDRCPACQALHRVVSLYEFDDHAEIPPNDYLNGARLPCGAVADLILERWADDEPSV